MAQNLVVSVGADMVNRGTYYWNMKTAAGDVIYVQKGFDSLDHAKADLDEFKKNLMNAVVIENQ